MTTIKSLLLMVPLASLVTGVAIVACGPQKEYVPVKVVQRAPLVQALADCRSQMSETRVIRVHGASRVASICEVAPKNEEPSNHFLHTSDSLEARSGAPHLPAQAGLMAPRSYQMVDREISYTVSNRENKLSVNLNVGVELPTSMKAEEQEAITRLINDSCVPKLNNVFRRSVTGVDVALNVNLISPKADSLKTVDQILKIQRVPGSSSGFQLSQWPDRGNLYLTARPIDQSSCFATDQTCLNNAREKVNQYFCASFSILVGHWLGLEAPPELQVRCADSSTTGTVSLLSLGTPFGIAGSSDTSFMKAGVQMRGREFLDAARFSTRDLKTVLGPACRSMQALPDDAKTDRVARR